MKADIHKAFSKVKPLPKFTINKRVSVFFICLAISFLFWFLIKFFESKSVVDFSIIYTGLPNGWKVSSQSDSVIIISVKSTGLNMFSLKYITNKPTLRIPIGNSVVDTLNRRKAHIIISSFKDSVIDQLKFSEEITSIKPDTLVVRLSRNATSKIVK